MKEPVRTISSPEKIKELRSKMIEHLEHAIAAADAAGDYARATCSKPLWTARELISGLRLTQGSIPSDKVGASVSELRDLTCLKCHVIDRASLNRARDSASRN